MEDVNYIKHLNAILRIFNQDERIRQGHITLYLALFQRWNGKRFPETFKIYRSYIMEKAKMKSKTTYHKYIRDLDDWKYIVYYPSQNPAQGSKVLMTNFQTYLGQKMAMTVPEEVQNMVSLDKQYKQENNNKLARPKNEQVVLSYFEIKNWPVREARKFFYYFEAIDWKMGGKISIVNWQASANSWMLMANEREKNKFKADSHLYVNTKKNYDEPL